jgi:hypothetical protein
MKFKTQKSVTNKITSNNLNSMGFNSFLLRSTFGLLFIHGYIEINNTSGCIWCESWISHHIKATFVEFFVLLQSLSAKIASMSNVQTREIIRYPNRYFTYVHIAPGKGSYFFSRTENTVIIFHLVSIVKYNNKCYYYTSYINYHK